MKELTKAVAFCRESASLKIEDIDASLELQEEIISKAAKSRDVKVVKYWNDIGSGDIELQAIYEFCTANQDVTYLFVTRLTRLARSLGQYHHWREKFAGIGVEIVAVTAPPIDASPAATEYAAAVFYDAVLSNEG